MKIEITFQEVKEKYPGVWKDFEKKRKKSKAKGARGSLEKATFSYDWCHQGKSYSFSELIKGKAQQTVTFYTSMSLEDRLKDQLSKCLVRIQVKRGRWYLNSDRLKEIPACIKDVYKNSLEEDEKWDRRVVSLTPEEQENQQEIEEALIELNKDPGFATIIIPGTS